jgi:hypothetical protein
MSEPRRRLVSFKVGDPIRYTPGSGTYGYEESIEADGRVPGVVIGFTRTRVRLRLTLTIAGRKSQLDRAVDYASVRRVDPS